MFFTLDWLELVPQVISQETVSAVRAENLSLKLATSGLPIPDSGANYLSSIAAARQTLNVLTDGVLEKVSVTQLLEQSGDLSPLQVICGDLVEIDVPGSAHQSVLCGVEFQHRGMKPIELRWHALVLGDTERPQVMFKGLPVMRGGVPVERIA